MIFRGIIYCYWQ